MLDIIVLDFLRFADEDDDSAVRTSEKQVVDASRCCCCWDSTHARARGQFS
jgi:hypothetical protein